MARAGKQGDLFGGPPPIPTRPPRDPEYREVWTVAKQWFDEAGIPDRQWRPVIGSWLGKFGTGDVLAVCRAGLDAAPIDPIAWGRAAIRARSGEDEYGETADERYRNQLARNMSL